GARCAARRYRRAARAGDPHRGLSRGGEDVRGPQSPRAARRRQVTAESESPAEAVADIHGPRRAEIAKRVRRAVEVADASAERRRVVLVERVLDPRADAMAACGVEVVGGREIDDAVSAVLDAPD